MSSYGGNKALQRMVEVMSNNRRLSIEDIKHWVYGSTLIIHEKNVPQWKDPIELLITDIKSYGIEGDEQFDLKGACGTEIIIHQSSKFVDCATHDMYRSWKSFLYAHDMDAADCKSEIDRLSTIVANYQSFYEKLSDEFPERLL